MRKVYKNALANNPRYIKVLVIMAIVIALISTAIIIYSIRELKTKSWQLSAEEFGEFKEKINYRIYLQVGVGMMTIILMGVLATLKRKEKIVITPQQIEYKGFFKQTAIPWDAVRDVKILHQGSPIEKCRIRGQDKSITFHAFFLDASYDYKPAKDGIYDQHGKVVSSSVKKGKLYKEVMMRAKT